MKVLILALFFFISGNAFASSDFPTLIRIEVHSNGVEVYEARTNTLLWEYDKSEEEYKIFFETAIEAKYFTNQILEENFNAVHHQREGFRQ